ncbi:MAG: type II secretion system F family protein [Bacillota bacterium]
MPVFIYRARTGAGELVQGRADAGSERELIGRLRAQGLLVLGVETERDLNVIIQQQGFLLFNRRVSGKDLAVFARQFATMVNAGLPVVQCLRVLARQTGNQRLARTLDKIANDVEAGEGLSEAFARHGRIFPPVMIHMMAAGEVGGILDETMNRVATQLEKDEMVRQKIRSAMVYPSIVMGVAVLVVIFLMTFVVPQFVQVYADLGGDLPGPTRLLITVSAAMRTYWYLFLLGGAAGFYATKAWWATEQGATLRDRLILKLPIAGLIVTKANIARFGRTLGGLLSSGVPILKALAVVQRTLGNRVIAAAVRDALEEVREGQTLVVPLRRSGAFPPMVVEMLAVGEETGTMTEMLNKVADFYEEEVQRSAERLSSTLEPLVIVFLAVTVGFIVVSMMMPIFDLWTMF